MSRRTLCAVAVLAAVTLGGGGISALAATPDSHAVKKHKVSKHKVSTKTGPRGARGAAGATGKKGAPGAAGVAGTNGTNGTNGSGGSNGPNGSNGSNGASGAPGVSFLRTVIVSPTETTQTGNGALLRAAIAGLTNVNSGNPALVWVEPGIYDVGSTTLSLPANVDLAGSGQDTTTIQGEGTLTLSTGANTEVRDVSVVDTDASGVATAISTAGGLADVTARASGTSAAIGVVANTPSMTLLDVSATANTSFASSSASAIETINTVTISGGTFTANDSAGSGQAAGLSAENAAAVNGATLQATGGSAAYPVALIGSSQTVTVIASTLVGTGGLFVPLDDTLDIGASQIPGVITGVTGTAVCANDWHPNFAQGGNTCG
jgi:hypothetical protein